MNPIDAALRRPWTVVVGVVALLLLAGVAVRRMRIDVFPNLDAPVVYVCQPYGGMDPAQMEGLLTNYYEYHFLYIGGIHHVESRSVQGMAIMKLVFHPGTDMAQAMAETIGYVTRARAFMPPGTVSPFITRFDGGSVPVGYLVLSSATKTIGEIQDQALFKVRPMFAGLPGVSAPPPFGGSQRTVVVRLDPDRLQALAMSPDEVLDALVHGNTISPSGVIRIGDEMPIVTANTLVRDVADLLDIPVRRVGDTVVFLRDVGTVTDSSDVTTGYALVDGRRAVYILVTKRAEASTLAVVDAVRAALPDMQAVLPDDIRVGFEFDQSPTVTRAIASLVTEALFGAGLVGLVTLLFLRDWRSAAVVVATLPFALAGGLVGLWLTRQSLNLMTLGGLALAVGIVVDEATVEVENIHARLARRERSGPAAVSAAVRDGNVDTALPRLLALVCIVAVFLPGFFMTGTARALFVPLSLAVVFSMTASYVLSSTLVPVAAAWALRPAAAADHGPGPVARAVAFLVATTVRWRAWLVPMTLTASAAALWWLSHGVGLEIFPRVDAGRFQVRIEAPTGTRIERTEAIVRQVLAAIDEEAGGDAIAISVGYAGLIPASYPINAIYQWTAGPEEAVVRVALRAERHVDTTALVARLRTRLAAELPAVGLSFEPADIVSEVMSLGAPTPVEVAVSGPSFDDTRAHAARIRAALAALPGLRDVRFAQALDYPTVRVAIDRRRAGASGVAVDDIARSLVTATSSSRFVVPNYWPDPKTGIGYQVQLEIPLERMTGVDDIARLPVEHRTAGTAPAPAGGPAVLLRDVADIGRGSMPGQFDRYNMRRTISITANVAGTDLGSASRAVAAAVAATGPTPKGVKVDLRGQLAPLDEIVRGLSIGLVAAVVVILLVLTAAFQSPRLALIAVSGAPVVIVGVAVALRITGTTLNLQSFMGAIMALGVSTANAILLVSFAERERRGGRPADGAARQAAADRLRPILMTSLAMIAGMLPLAIGIGEGGEQSAPLGRAVIGGLGASVFTTLLLLPGIYALLMRGRPVGSPSLHPADIGGRVAPGVVVPALLALALVAGCNRPAPAPPATAPAAAAAPRVDVVTPVRGVLRRTVRQPGRIEAAETALLVAKVSGIVERIGVDIGDTVAAGDVLAEIAVPELRAERQRQEAVVAHARAAVRQAESRLTAAQAGGRTAVAKIAEAEAAVTRSAAERDRRRAEFERAERLVADGAVTGALADELRAQLAAAEAGCQEAAARVRLAEALVMEATAAEEEARADLDTTRATVEVAVAEAGRIDAALGYARIVAPFPGVVTRRLVDPGHLTGGDSPAVLEIARVDRLRAVVAVPESDAALVEAGDPVEIRLPALPGVVIQSRVARTGWSLSDTTRTLRTEVDLDPQAGGPAGRIRPGGYVEAVITTASRDEALAVPPGALLPGESPARRRLFVVVDGRTVERGVTIGLETADGVEIVSGLADGESIARAPRAEWSDGPPAAKGR
jgi:RND family efflux transporter MFP subunit